LKLNPEKITLSSMAFWLYVSLVPPGSMCMYKFVTLAAFLSQMLVLGGIPWGHD